MYCECVTIERTRQRQQRQQQNNSAEDGKNGFAETHALAEHTPLFGAYLWITVGVCRCVLDKTMSMKSFPEGTTVICLKLYCRDWSAIFYGAVGSTQQLCPCVFLFFLKKKFSSNQRVCEAKQEQAARKVKQETRGKMVSTCAGNETLQIKCKRVKMKAPEPIKGRHSVYVSACVVWPQCNPLR